MYAKPGIALILSGFPRRSETFALNEALALANRGLLVGLYATKQGDGLTAHPECAEIVGRVTYLPEAPIEKQINALFANLDQVNGRHAVRGIHGYFAHQPAQIAAAASRKLGVPYGFSVHAKDARKVAHDKLIQQADDAVCVVACNDDVAQEFEGARREVDILRHGVDCQRFSPQPWPRSDRFELLAVGRLVEKKGFDVLIEAAQYLSIPFRLRIVGDGPLKSSLEKQIQKLGLQEVVSLLPSISHANLPSVYGSAHVVIVPSVVDRNGDRDGLPNVVLEAMASGRPVIASDVAAISSAIRGGQHGLLVAPNNPTELAAAVAGLWLNEHIRLDLGIEARRRVMAEFDLQQCSERFCDYIEEKYGLRE